MDGDRYTQVYTNDDATANGLVEIQPEYVYIRIPADYICIYHKILTMFADFGVDMLSDCCAGCKDNNKQLIECYNMFNAAVAARQLGYNKLAETLIKYIEGQLDIEYNGNAPCPGHVYPVDEDGRIKAMVSCEKYPKFYVDLETGKLWEEYQKEHADTVYTINDDNLTRTVNEN